MRPLGTWSLLRLELARWTAGVSNALQATDADSRRAVARALAAVSLGVGGALVVLGRLTTAAAPAALDATAVMLVLSAFAVVVVAVDAARRSARTHEARSSGIDHYLLGAPIARSAVAVRATLGAGAVVAVAAWVPLAVVLALPGDVSVEVRIGALALTLGVALLGDALGVVWRASAWRWRLVLVVCAGAEVVGDIAPLVALARDTEATGWRPRGAVSLVWEAVVRGTPGVALGLGVAVLAAGLLFAVGCRWWLLQARASYDPSLRARSARRVGSTRSRPTTVRARSRAGALWSREVTRLVAWVRAEPVALVGVLGFSGCLAWSVRWMDAAGAEALTGPMILPWFLLMAVAVPTIALTHVLWADETPGFTRWLHALLPAPVLAPTLRATLSALILAGWTLCVVAVLATRTTALVAWHALGLGVAMLLSASALVATTGVLALLGEWQATAVGRLARTASAVGGLVGPVLVVVTWPASAGVSSTLGALGLALVVACGTRVGLARMLSRTGPTVRVAPSASPLAPSHP